MATESVYMLHGFMRTSNCMNKMAKTFNKEGHEAIRWNYPSRKAFIEDHAQSLVDLLNKTAEKNPEEPIHFVTHSLGGIVVRAALNHKDCPQEAKIGKAVLLSPPNQGSCFARALSKSKFMCAFVGDKAGAQLFNHLNFEHLGQFPPTMDVMVISGSKGWNPLINGEAHDGKVTVAEGALTTPHQHITVKAGHAFIMMNTKTIRLALDFIQSEATQNE